jgi:hypothetical protein
MRIVPGYEWQKYLKRRRRYLASQVIDIISDHHRVKSRRWCAYRLGRAYVRTKLRRKRIYQFMNQYEYWLP